MRHLIFLLVLLFPQLAQAQPKASATLQKGVIVGAAKSFGSLTVFPVFASVQQKLGEFTTLQQALKMKMAIVHERKDGARVNELIIENKGQEKILVLAGTVVKGGKQDRQVAQDFIISAKTKVPIDAFCVEQGRWNGSRDGKATGGYFSALETLAMSNVRVAGQYKGNQQEVWNEVSKVNADNLKSTASGTLTATLSAPDVKKKRKGIAKKVNDFLASTPKNLVGVAYAVGGKVRNVRWFMNGQVFGMFQNTLVNTAVVEALTAESAAKTAGKKVKTHEMHPRAVAAFVKKIAAAKKTATKTKNDNAYHYRFGKKGAASKTMYRSAPSAPPKAVSEDYSAY
jgi:hypothetical protein